MSLDRRRIKSTRRQKFITQKYFLLLASLMLIFSSFSSLPAVIFAEGDQQQELDASFSEVGDNEEEAEDENGEGNESGRIDDADDDEGAPEEESSEENSEEDADEEEQGDEGLEQGNPSIDEKVELEGQSFSVQPFVAGGIQPFNTPVKDFSWEKINNDREVEITKYEGDDKEIEIPSEINGLPVTTIGREAFMNKSLTSIKLPDSVTTIGWQAFRNNELKNIDLPNNLKQIDSTAFYENKLEEIVFPNSVESVSSAAFAQNNLTKVTIPDSITNMESNPFYGNPNVKFEATGTEYDDGEGNYLKKGDTLIAGNSTGTIPNDVTTIGDYAFYYSQLTSVTISENIKKIGSYAFANNELTKVTIPNSVTEIGGSAFSDNELTSVDLPENISEIKSRTFRNNNLESVTIPSNVTKIGSSAFYDNNLKNVDIPEGIEEISENAFAQNELKKVTIPDSITTMESNPFYGNPDVTFEATGTEYDVGEGNYLRRGTGLIAGNGTGEIPNGVTSIGSSAFANNELTKVTIPDSVQFIGYNAFFNNKLEEVIIPQRVTSIGTGAFGQNDLTDVTILNSDVNIYGTAFSGNQTNPADLTIQGYEGSSADDYATDHSHNFEAFSDVIVDGAVYSIKLGENIGIKDLDDNLVATLQIPDTVQPDGVLDNAKLEVKTVTPVDPPSDIAGVVLEFTFKDVNDDPIQVTGNFELSLLLNDSNKRGAAIYHQDESNSEWKWIGGDVTNKYITATVNNFSSYGVFSTDFLWEDNGDGTLTLKEYAGIESNVVIPDLFEEKPVTVIGEFAFFDKQLESVTIPSSVEAIETLAFFENNLTNVIITDSVKTIGDGAFSSNQLENVTIPKSVETIGDGAFYENNLEKVTVYNSQTTFGNHVFSENQNNRADLTIEGYAQSTAETLANDNGFTFVPFSEVVVDGNALPIKLGMAVTVKDANNDEIAKLKIPNDVQPNDALDIATLEVKAVDPIIATGLTEAGAVLDFTFRNASGDEIKVSGDFELSLFVDDVTKDIAIYHEIAPDDWESKDGTVAGNFITATVNHFSAYGVFYEVILESIETLANISVDYGTELNDVPLPTDVEVILDDNTKRTVKVNWDGGNPVYDGTQPGSYQFVGNLQLPNDVINPDDLKASVTVVVDDEPVPVVVKDALKAVIDEAESYDEDDYTDESFSKLTAALFAARDVYEDDDATQDDVDEAARKLQESIDSLIEKEPVEEPDDPIEEPDDPIEEPDDPIEEPDDPIEEPEDPIDDPDSDDESEEPGKDDESEDPKTDDESEDPKTDDESEDPGTDDESEEPKDKDEETTKDEKEKQKIVTINDKSNGTTDKTVHTSDSIKILPKTATSWFTLLGIGLGLLVMGLIALIITQRKKSL